MRLLQTSIWQPLLLRHFCNNEVKFPFQNLNNFHILIKIIQLSAFFMEFKSSWLWRLLQTSVWQANSCCDTFATTKSSLHLNFFFLYFQKGHTYKNIKSEKVTTSKISNKTIETFLCTKRILEKENAFDKFQKRALGFCACCRPASGNHYKTLRYSIFS